MKAKTFLSIGAIFAGLSVVIGAFAAHALKKILPIEKLAVVETAVQYQFFHALAIILIAIFLLVPSLRSAQKYFVRSGLCFIIGTLLFCGSLYALVSIGKVWLGPITPIGGLFFIIGWGYLALSARKLNE